MWRETPWGRRTRPTPTARWTNTVQPQSDGQTATKCTEVLGMWTTRTLQTRLSNKPACGASGRLAIEVPREA